MKIFHKLTSRLFKWVFSAELAQLNDQIVKTNKAIRNCEDMESRLKRLLRIIDIDVSVDVHEHRHSPSWAVISIQGQKVDYIKFIDLGHADINEIQHFLRIFDQRGKGNIKIDATPSMSQFLRIKKKSERF